MSFQSYTENFQKQWENTDIHCRKKEKRFQKTGECQRHSKLKTVINSQIANEQSALDKEPGLKLRYLWLKTSGVTRVLKVRKKTYRKVRCRE